MIDLCVENLLKFADCGFGENIIKMIMNKYLIKNQMSNHQESPDELQM